MIFLFLSIFRGGGGGRGNNGEFSSKHGRSDLPESVDNDNRGVVKHAQPQSNVFDDPFVTTEILSSCSDIKNGNVQDVFAEHKLSTTADGDDDIDTARLQSYMKKRGQRRPSQDFLDSRHLLPWQRFNQESRKYASVKFVIPEKSKQENASNNNNEHVKYPFEFTPSTQSSISSLISESSLPSTTSSLTLNLSESPSPAFSSSTSESNGSDRNVKPEASLREPYGVDDCSREKFEKLQKKRVVHNQTTTTNIAHHVPTTQSTSTSYHGDNTDVRQTLSDKYYQRRRSHQTPGSYDRSRGDLPLGYSKPKGFRALKGIFETESGEGIFSMQIGRG